MTSAAVSQDMAEKNKTDLHDQLIEANVNAESRLATDYLNHYNEVFMLLEMVPDMPEMMDEIVDWAPKSYEEHFRNSSLADKELVIEAYEAAPLEFRRAFDLETGILDTLFGTMIDDLVSNKARVHESYGIRIEEIRQQMGCLNSIIHGRIPDKSQVALSEEHGETVDQSAIDALFD